MQSDLFCYTFPNDRTPVKNLSCIHLKIDIKIFSLFFVHAVQIFEISLYELSKKIIRERA